MSLQARAPENTAGTIGWVDADKVKAWYLDQQADDARVVWLRAANGSWQQAWPEPERIVSIGGEWDIVGGQSALKSINWSPVLPEYSSGFVNTIGDLIVEYTAVVYWGGTIKDANGVPDPARATSQVALTVPQRATSWTLPTPAPIGDKNEYAIDVIAHYRFHNGATAVDQNPPVSRTSYTDGISPTAPLPVPANLRMTWITDAGISVGTRTGVGHFRNAATLIELAAGQRRPAVAPTVQYVFPPLGPEPAATLPVSSRPVTLTWVESVTATRAPITAAQVTAYDFPAQNGQPALTKAADPTRTYKHEVPVQIASTLDANAAIVGTDRITYVVAPGETVKNLSWDLTLTNRAGARLLVDPPKRSIMLRYTPVATALVPNPQSLELPIPLLGGSDDTQAIMSLPIDLSEGTLQVVLVGAGWRTYGTVAADVIFTVERTATQFGVPILVDAPWDGRPGTPGDPGAATIGQVTHTQVVSQPGVRQILPWDGVPGSPGDPGAPVQLGPDWSWPFNFQFDAVTGAESYQYRFGSGPWQAFPNVPASALGPTASGTLTLTDQWLPVGPTRGMQIQVRGVKKVVGVDEPGLIATHADTVPGYPSIGPVRNLRVLSKGYRYATLAWLEPTVNAAASHYFSGNYRISGGGAWKDTTSETDYVDLGVPADPNYGPWEETAANAPTPGGYTRQGTGLAVDPGAPAVDVGRPTTLQAVPVTGWGADGPTTSVADTLLPRFISFNRGTASSATSTPPVTTWTSGTRTFPATERWTIGNGYYFDTPILGAFPAQALGTWVTTVGQSMPIVSGIGNVQVLQVEPPPRPALGPPGTTASGPFGAFLKYGLSCQGGHIIGVDGYSINQPDFALRVYQLDAWSNGQKVLSYQMPVDRKVDGDGPFFGKPTAGGVAGGYDAINITEVDVGCIGNNWRMHTLGFWITVQPDPIVTPAVPTTTPGTFTPPSIAYQPVENQP